MWCLLPWVAATWTDAEVPVLERGPDEALMCPWQGEVRRPGRHSGVARVIRLTALGGNTACFPLGGSSFLL